ncbi:MAG TPA: isoprenylcysteine carboxylmethyltransferase family protein, partial [Anaerolineales bacterium]|nr:isoprenylcysteine carboxylmethyltransferase family protein [Anaerolineales bacterium]
MNIQNIQPERISQVITAGILTRGIQILLMIVILGLVLFLAAGSLRWIAAWVYLGINLLIVVINATLMLRTNPETVAERGQAKVWQGWDKLVSGLFAIFQYLILPLVAGLDARFHWSGENGIFWHGFGTAVFTASMAGNSWAMITNAYFSTAARIQADRSQQVCQTGPYKYIRHPGYTSIILQSLSTAIMLGSLWAMIPAAAAGASIITRTALENKMLKAELAGYSVLLLH